MSKIKHILKHIFRFNFLSNIRALVKQIKLGGQRSKCLH